MRNILNYTKEARKYFAYGVKCMWRNKKLFWAFLLFCQMSPLPWVVDLVIFGFALYNLVQRWPVSSPLALYRFVKEIRIKGENG